MPPRRAISPRILLALAGLIAASCGHGESDPAIPAVEAPTTARTVEAACAGLEPWEEVLRLPGELDAFERATLSAKVPGRLAWIGVDIGSFASEGEVVARIDPRDYELLVADAEAELRVDRARLGLAAGEQDVNDPDDVPIVREARAQLDEARLERDRLATLIHDDIASRSEFDTAEAQVRAAEGRWQAARDEVATLRAAVQQRRAALAIARQRLGDTEITSPFRGAITERIAGLGDYLMAGDPIARLVRIDPLRLRLRVPELSAWQVATGQEVRLQLPGPLPAVDGAPELPVSGRIVRMSPEIDPATRTLLVEAELQNPDGRLRPGSFGRAEIVLQPDARTLVVPVGALVRFAGTDKVFVVQDGIARETRVRVGRAEPERVEILDGIAAGDAVVLDPGNLRDGAPVTIAASACARAGG